MTCASLSILQHYSKRYITQTSWKRARQRSIYNMWIWDKREKNKILNLYMCKQTLEGYLIVNWTGWKGEWTVCLMFFGFETLRMNVLLKKWKKNGNDFSCSVYLGFSPTLCIEAVWLRLHLDGMLYMLCISGFHGLSKSCWPHPSLQSFLPLVAWTWISSGYWRKPGVTQRARSLLQRSQTCSCPHPGTLSSEHSALMWLSWFFPQSEGSPRETVLSILAKCYRLIGRKKMAECFPRLFLCFSVQQTFIAS